MILITGASSGIGRCAALELLSAGHVVYAAARRVSRMDELASVGARVLQLDVTDEASLRRTLDTVLFEQGRIDVLVNNAGYGSYGALENVPMEEARRQFDVNVFGLSSLTRMVLPVMRSQGSGRIVNVASMAGHFCEPHGGWYHATKYAVVALSECLRMEVKPFGIRVSLIEPGAIRSEWSDIAMDHLETVSAGTPYESGAARHSRLFRWAYSHLATRPEVIARAIVRASTSRRPRLRYRRGLGSHSFLFLKSVLPGRWFDALMRFFFS